MIKVSQIFGAFEMKKLHLKHAFEHLLIKKGIILLKLMEKSKRALKWFPFLVAYKHVEWFH